jgi:tetratricopeptide (TPR) repeat protein
MGQQPAASGRELVIQGKMALRAGVDANDAARILAARALFERATTDPGVGDRAGYFAALADHKLATTLGMAGADKKGGAAHADAAIKRLEQLTRRNPADAESWALLGSALGQRIAFSPVQGMWLGPRSGRALERARATAPDNPRVALLSAISTFNTPKAWGGNPGEGERGFGRAAALFAAARATGAASGLLSVDWGEDEAHAWLGIARRKRGDMAGARQAWEAALRVNPTNNWVRNVLLPALDRTTAPAR